MAQSRYCLLTFSSDDENKSDSNSENVSPRDAASVIDPEVSFRGEDKSKIISGVNDRENWNSNDEFNHSATTRGRNCKISRPVVNLPTFNGFSKESIIEFLEEFDRAALINGWDDRAQALLFPVYLGWLAKDVYQSLDKT